MSNGESSIRRIATIDHAAMVADGLESVVADIRSGQFPTAVRRCVVIVSGPADDQSDNVGLMHFGADTALPLLLGLLELAKYQAIEADS